MQEPLNFKPYSCRECAEGAGLGFQLSMAFQPIVNLREKRIFAHEALVRGVSNEPAGQILGRVSDQNRYAFDQACRVKAIQMAARLQMPTCLSINFLPNAIYRPELCIRTTIAAAEEYGFPLNQVIFEVTEGEQVADHAHLTRIIQYYQQKGFLTAIDDFGAGYSGLNLLVSFRPDIIKLDMFLIRDIDQDKGRRAIVRGIVQVCNELNIQVIAEGIETAAELAVLQDMGLEYFQGYYFARPAFEALAEVPLLAA
ncbi:MAG: EAL domain-containing protein [Candidatus Sericytochromatia bacterium]|nr:EAL domain-containing protein [Candidatus Sericytochromatia bacterium]